jgi:DNA-binding CsgD family transcriptional regulator
MSREERNVLPPQDSTAVAALVWLDLDRRAHMIVDSQLRLVWANGTSERIMRDCRELEQRDGTLFATDSEANERLLRLVRQCDETLSTLLIRSAGGDSYLLLRLQRLLHEEDRCLVGICLIRSGAEEESSAEDYDGIDQAFGLTPAEYRILRALIDGRTADEIASTLLLSVDTVRSHIRRIYDKMDVSSREGLFRRIRPFSY